VRAALIVRPPNHAGAVVLARTAKVRALPRINAYSDNCAGTGFDRSAIDAPGRRESAPGIQPLRNAMLAPSVARLLKDGVLSGEGGSNGLPRRLLRASAHPRPGARSDTFRFDGSAAIWMVSCTFSQLTRMW
jgi:hypothetical protein